MREVQKMLILKFLSEQIQLYNACFKIRIALAVIFKKKQGCSNNNNCHYIN